MAKRKLKGGWKLHLTTRNRLIFTPRVTGLPGNGGASKSVDVINAAKASWAQYKAWKRGVR